MAGSAHSPANGITPGRPASFIFTATSTRSCQVAGSSVTPACSRMSILKYRMRALPTMNGIVYCLPLIKPLSR